MPPMINVTDEDILYTEGILLAENQHFDDERRAFIRNFRTLDLQAVPGSGKTTALLAKLLILERYMPFNDGKGILLVSHTNAAIDEIKARIGSYCPRLFKYPNFIGTIQSFVDTFLAIPFYINCYKAKPFRIDSETYNEQVEKFYNNTPNQVLRGWLSKQHDGLGLLKSIRFSNDEVKLIKYLAGTINDFPLKDSNSPTYKALFKFKVKLLQQGYLHYDDGYTLANYQLKKHPKTKTILQQRFKYIFVDEMQDMDTHQYELLEKLFFDEGRSSSFYQRVGDCNQAIFNGFSSHETHIWEQRQPTLYINGSHRINQNLAPLIQNLALTSNTVLGLRMNNDGSPIDIKPHIIVFDDTNIQNVISKYGEIIERLQAEGKIPTNPKHKFAAVAWRKHHTDTDKLGLSDYWNEYSTVKQENKIDYQVLEDYLLYFDKEIQTLTATRKSILNAFLKILRLEDIQDEKGRMFSKRKLMNHLKEKYSSEYKELKLKTFQWSMGLIKGNIEVVIEGIREYLPHFLSLFGTSITESTDFINNSSSTTLVTSQVVEQSNIYETNNIQIEVGTVHSVKGQTHIATLYLETFFQRGYGNYESERIRNQILGTDINQILGTSVGGKGKIRQTAKMTYVGFSRATHLLCIAVHKNRFDSLFDSSIDRSNWEIVES
jgi:DNA helicase-2/ATP-dependent DNA helicase PcrA